MANSAVNNNMFDYFESYMRKKSKKRYTPDLRQYSSKKTLIEESIEDILQQEINDENRKGQIQRKGFQTPRNNERIDTSNRILQSKIMLTGQKKVAKHILNNHTEVSPKRDEGQKEIFQNLRECFSFMPQQSLMQDKKLNQVNIKRKDEDDKKEKLTNLPPISQHYIDTQNPVFNYQSFHYNQLSLLSSNSNDKKISFKTTRKNTMLKRLDEKPLSNPNQKNNIQIKIGETDLSAKKCYTDFDSIKLDSVNIMNNSSFKSYDFQEVQKQAIIQQAEKQQQKEMRKINNLNRGLDRLNFLKGRSKVQPTPQEPFIGLVFQDYENYTPIHSSNYRRSPLIPEQEQNQSFELPQPYIADSIHHTITNKKQKSNKINHSFF